ncbi:hypothetical protein PHYSODRAFT_323449 [Phytophthora sojae]|uniref:Uncharacterized protein n=1 Tax=Phytophthora sojae (strain P6497) TaxID=1094619 RepID=G4YL92_PHYSP|nr:hypothetical protein PHYSODRAFT_323449 [Phytophthora sojae]EGZ30007.1 hypothetical protein PHYSODRAFT_323449 [Phytophthora sojae]|eukprot:XP_009517282.1 hypothetical protein PHYSODRAFT_323449 [Phytophthora sojae]
MPRPLSAHGFGSKPFLLRPKRSSAMVLSARASSLALLFLRRYCHVALLVLPPEHEFIAPYISMDSIQDPVFRARFEKLRSSKIGQFVLWCYRNKRPMPAAF